MGGVDEARATTHSLIVERGQGGREAIGPASKGGITMADIVKREDVGNQLIKRDLGEVARHPMHLMRELARDPFQALRDLMSWDPFREMVPVGRGALRWSPDFEIRETKDSYVFKADLPGTKKDDLDISLVGNRLAVTGKREEEVETKDDTYFACERTYGSFTRTFTLPDTADTEHISSELRDGVLTLVIPKKEGAQARKIDVRTGEKS